MKTLLIIPTLFATALFAGAAPQLQGYLDGLQAEVKKNEPAFNGFSAERGEKVFTSKHIGKRGKEVACTSCHSTVLTNKGENINTGKVIEPLAPSANPKSLSDVKNVKKWLRRNFKDVYTRVGTAKEKGDVLTYILNH